MEITKDSLKKYFQKEKYEVRLFTEKGFIRKKCSKCGAYFWTLSPDVNECGDTVCVGGYKFITNKATRKWDLHEAIKKWCEFFEVNGHKRIREYPVVARWRDDLYFTIASIANFQPWVINGAANPPANPLVVPQPCIRFGGKGFCDIDNVGRTGRHLSSFIMGGQHAFNSDKRNLKAYWMDRCIELNYNFLVNYLKLKPEEITYREDVWIGGGNFGPSLEAFCGGLEIVNNVFIQYELFNEGFRELDLKIVDVGWGMERISWFTQGTPTIYDATFPNVLEYMRKQTGIKADEEILVKYSILSGILNVDECVDLNLAKKHIAEKMGISYEELSKTLAPLESLYAIADHTRTLVFALADGAIPSNVGGGYNLRVLLRRVFNLNEMYNFNLDINKICKMHVDYLKKTYPQVSGCLSILDDILEIERKRYYKTLASGKTYVKSLLRKGKRIDVDTLIEMYESKGIPPELVENIAKQEGKKFEIPGDFYLKLEARHRMPKAVKEGYKLPIDPTEVEGVPRTEKIYYSAPYAKTFSAQVLRILNGRYLILDKTAFYPTGGGQLCDEGYLGGIKVVNVFKVGEVIVHTLEKECLFKEGDTVEGVINWDRRWNIMRNHTATHIVNSAARRVLGDHVWQAGAEKTVDKARLDITHYKMPTPDEIKEIEELSNNVVVENRHVKIYTMLREKAEEKYGFRIYQGGVVPGKELRIVEVENWEVEACGGTHVRSTGEIGLIKIVNVERIQDSVVRLEFKTGPAAIKYIQSQEEILKQSAEMLRVPVNLLPSAVKKFFTSYKELKKEVERLREKTASKIKTERVQINDFTLNWSFLPGESVKALIKTAAALLDSEELVLLIGSNGKKYFVLMATSKLIKKGINCGEIAKKVCQKLKGGGGGKEDLGQGACPTDTDPRDILTEVIAEIKQLA
ncbi:MAG: alanine--tRNA ligase [Candidatus Odinarchaeia archaeon]